VIVRQGERVPFALDHSAASRRDFVDGLKRSSGGAVFAAIERNFPDDYQALVDRLLDVAINAHGDAGAAATGGFRETYAFLRSKSADILNAPAASLMTVNDRTLALYRAAAATDVGFCGQFAVRGVTDPGALPRTLASQMSAITIAMIEAAGAGHRAGEHPAGRGTIVPENAAAWMTRMRALDSTNEVVPLLANQGALEQAAPALQCRVGTMIHEAIGGLPPEQGASILAYFLSLSFQTRQP